MEQGLGKPRVWLEDGLMEDKVSGSVTLALLHHRTLPGWEAFVAGGKEKKYCRNFKGKKTNKEVSEGGKRARSVSGIG